MRALYKFGFLFGASSILYCAQDGFLSEEKVQELRNLKLEKEARNLESLKQMFNEENKRILKYTKDPSAQKMLAYYTIYPDLQFYQFKSSYFYGSGEEKIINLDPEQIVKSPITKAQINERISHALEAERILNNIFVPVEFVLDEIKQKGKYIPPGIFFKFYGYIYFQIRDKPIIKENLINSGQYISLFDLYFNYNNPIQYYHREYTEFPLYCEEKDWIPNAYFNQSLLPKIYLKGAVKNVMVGRPASRTPDESTYDAVWADHYN